MIQKYRLQGMTLDQISAAITDECCTNYNCKDNVTLMLIDLKKHLADWQRMAKQAPFNRAGASVAPQQPPSFNNVNSNRRYHSQARTGGMVMYGQQHLQQASTVSPGFQGPQIGGFVQQGFDFGAGKQQSLSPQ
mmetsp:Transcript_39636/g.60687  ORF Transcript_39636/g.60687 Transcript_39636/m.60687 type:complete len:134 (+) Transcript_39636:1398-1799(+)